EAAIVQAHVDDPLWPPAETTWSSRRIYDGTDATPNMVGQMWQAQVNNSEQNTVDVSDTFAYDRIGNVLSQARTAGSGASAQTASLGHSYNAAGGLISTTDSATGLTSVNRFNPLGQIAAIDGIIGGETTSFLLLAYTQEGQPGSVSLLPAAGPLLTQSYEYNSRGWLLQSAGPVLTESLQYLQGSCDQSTCYTGTPARQTLTYQRGVSRTEDACLVSDYLGRITQAGNGAS